MAIRRRPVVAAPSIRSEPDSPRLARPREPQLHYFLAVGFVILVHQFLSWLQAGHVY